MCSAMCTLNIAGPYRPIPELVATSNAAHPHNQAIVRPAPQASPRRRSRRTPARYAAASTSAPVPKIRLNRQSRRRRSAVGGSTRS